MVLRSRPNRVAAGLMPWTFAYSSTAKRLLTFHRYCGLIERSLMKDPPFWVWVIPSRPGSHSKGNTSAPRARAAVGARRDGDDDVPRHGHDVLAGAGGG